MIEELDDFLHLLCSHGKLERDKGALSMKAFLLTQKSKDDSAELLSKFQESLIVFLENPTKECKWEDIFGRLEASKLIVEYSRTSPSFIQKLLSCGVKYLEHEEFRVRITAGEVLGTLCRVVDSNIYKECEGKFINSIKNNLIRDIPPTENHKDAKEIFHDTAGWKCLETSMKGLQSIIEGCGEKFLGYMNFVLLDLIFETLKHTNRFVRETGFYLCASLARHGVSSKESSNKEMADKLASHLSIGLADNWSQVRLAASVATRQFFQDMNSDDRKIYFRFLLPPMCLNRYYLAEGVKLYNQETWKLILGTEGRANVEHYIEDIVAFYITQTASDNHAVREAACHCMAELGAKINPDVVKPFVPKILDALHVCFKDDSWPVRDTACVACGNFILAFPVESKPMLDLLYPLFFANLCDPIPSVRQGAAVALTNVAKAHGDEALERIFQKIYSGLKQLDAQNATSERYEGMDKGTATYGVIKQLRDNDFDLHSNQQMYSCGSLAPKMNRGGCMDHSFQRASEPWELADGCVYLIAEMASLKGAQNYVVNCIDMIITASNFKHYTHYLHFYETICKVLPLIAKGLGKRVFKQHIEKFFDLIFESLSCEIALTKTAASECLRSLALILGPNILKGRVELHNANYVSTLEKVLRDNSSFY